ncbi:MAG: nickel pincer cofactor biosynthesis protein LarB [Chromatiales bacterium]|nr:nickel pincer cofactor biosynthesis protein LarB [Chromatiales bacterium]
MSRTGVGEAVFGIGKSDEQLLSIGQHALERGGDILFTRLSEAQGELLADALGDAFKFDVVSGTAAIGGQPHRPDLNGAVAVVAAGSSDRRAATEALQTLEFMGVRESPLVMDVGVAGLWRLLEQVEDLAYRRIVIAVAGMEGALFSVVAGLVRGGVIAVPTSVGYGVSSGGHAALNSALASCAPGVVTVNIDNGFGAACAAMKLLGPAPGAKTP